MSMDIGINKPYSNSRIYDVSFDYTTIRLADSEINDLFELLDNELHSDTREELLERIKELEESIQEAQETLEILQSSK